MKNFYLFVSLFVLVFISACSEKSKSTRELRLANGGMQYGGVFHINEVENFRSLFPHSTGDLSSYNIGSQVYEGLVKHDSKTLEISPAIAESWEISDNGLEYTFKIRDNIYFHDDPCFETGIGRKLTVNDCEFALKKLCTPSPMNSLFSMVIDRIAGAREFYEKHEKGESSDATVSGIVVLDEQHLKLVLTKPFTGFLKILATASCWIFPEEAYGTYGNEMRIKCVGTGPFKVVKIVDNEVAILEKNGNYWRKDEFGNTLPYLDALKFTFVKEKKSEILEFIKGNLDMVFQIPTEEIGELNIDVKPAKGEFKEKDFLVQISPSLTIQYYSFQHMSDIFKDVNVRKAFNYAIDKERIVDYGLQGLGFPAMNGIVPPSIADYPFDAVDGYVYSPEKAMSYMEKAGYPKGKGFPRLTLQLNSGGSENIGVAEIVQKMLAENLNVYVDLSVTSRSQHYDRVESGQSEFWKDAWLADYSDPENFLCLFYGELVPDDPEESSYMNSTRYKNSSFDELYEKANMEQDPLKRMALFSQADQMIIEDAAIIPLYYEKTVRLLKPYVKNFPVNHMEYRDLALVYFDFQEYEDALSIAY